MPDESESSQLTLVVIKLLGRKLFPEVALRKIILRSATSAKYLKAYNLCDGTRSRIEVARAAGLDKDNFNKRVNRWIQEGILFELGAGKARGLLHVYPLSSEILIPEEQVEEAAND